MVSLNVLLSLLDLRVEGMTALSMIEVDLDAEVKSHFRGLPGCLFVVAAIATSSDTDERIVHEEEEPQALLLP